MEQEAIRAEIIEIIEKKIVRRDLLPRDVAIVTDRLQELIGMMDDSALSEKLRNKIKDKKRFSYYINDTGNKDFTGYGRDLG